MSHNYKKRGFTLIELLVVIGIIGLLATFVTSAVQSARDNAKIVEAQHEIKLIYDAINMLANDTDEWPGEQPINQISDSNDREICNDTTAPNCIYGLSDARAGIISTNNNYFGWNGPYRESIPLDPWGNEYFFDTDYEDDGDTVVAIGSFGPNGEGKNDYDSDNIIQIIFK